MHIFILTLSLPNHDPLLTSYDIPIVIRMKINTVIARSKNLLPQRFVFAFLRWQDLSKDKEDCKPDLLRQMFSIIGTPDFLFVVMPDEKTLAGFCLSALE